MDAKSRSRLMGQCVFLSGALLAAAVVTRCGSTPTGPGTPTPTPAPTATSCTGAPPPMTSFSANPSTITEGDSFTLTWTAPCGFVTLSIKGQSPFTQNQPSNGSYELRSGANGYPAATGSTTYEATNGDVAQRFTATVTVNPKATPTPTATATATATPTPTCVPANCDDNNPCTTDACVSGVCQHTNKTSGTQCGATRCNVCNASGVCGNKSPGTWCAGGCGVCCSDGSCSGDGGTCNGDPWQCVGNDPTDCQTCPDNRDCVPRPAGYTCKSTGTCNGSGDCSI
jgi:hypothetical protein